ncbi:MAG TPA: hypothetical protein VGN12_15990 [Pirellulales bacterium]
MDATHTLPTIGFSAKGLVRAEQDVLIIDGPGACKVEISGSIPFLAPSQAFDLSLSLSLPISEADFRPVESSLILELGNQNDQGNQYKLKAR